MAYHRARGNEERMHLKKIFEFAQYLSDSTRTPDEISQYLVLSTLNEMNPVAIYFAEITRDAWLAPVAGFGFDRLTFESRGRFPLSMHIPITDSVKHDKCIVVNSPEELFEKYPELKTVEDINLDWQSLIVWPMLPNGVAFALLLSEQKMNAELEYFLRTIGEMFSLYQTQHSLMLGSELKNPRATVQVPDTLSDRQVVIVKLLLQGSTNLEIAKELGYSESLIRQETIQIYRILQVSGRKELIATDKTNNYSGLRP